MSQGVYTFHLRQKPKTPKASSSGADSATRDSENVAAGLTVPGEHKSGSSSRSSISPIESTDHSSVEDLDETDEDDFTEYPTVQESAEEGFRVVDLRNMEPVAAPSSSVPGGSPGNSGGLVLGRRRSLASDDFIPQVGDPAFNYQNVYREQLLLQRRARADSAGSNHGRSANSHQSHLSLTRQRFLPPKDMEEEKKHLQQHKDIMQKSMRREERRQRRREKERIRLMKKETKREQIWEEKLLPNWKESMLSDKKVVSLWWKGLSSRLRGRIWMRSFPMADYVNRYPVTEDEYQLFCKRAETLVASSASPISAAQLGPIFPTLHLFQQGAPLESSLRKLIHASISFNQYFPFEMSSALSVGAMLLLNVSEFDAFKCLYWILTKDLDYLFIKEQSKIFAQIFSVLLSQKIPSLFSLFQRQQIQIDAYVLEWCQHLFTKQLSLDLVTRVWDAFMLTRRAERFLHATSLTILSLLEQTLQYNSAEINRELLSCPDSVLGLSSVEEDAFMEHVLDYYNGIEKEFGKLSDVFRQQNTLNNR